MEGLDTEHLTDFSFTPFAPFQPPVTEPSDFEEELEEEAFDERFIRAGTSLQTALTRTLETIPSALVHLGDKGLGSWQDTAVQKLFIEQKRRGLMIILPVRLPGEPPAWCRTTASDRAHDAP